MNGAKRALSVAGILTLGYLVGAVVEPFNDDGSDPEATTTPVPMSTTTTLPCTSVEALVDARHLSNALSALSARGGCPNVDVAALESGIGASARLVAEAQAALASNDYDLARELALQALALNAGSDGAQAVIDGANAPDTTTTTRAPFAIAESLHELGLEEERDAAMVKAIEGGASADTAPDFGRDWRERVFDNWVRIVIGVFVSYLLIAELVRGSTRHRGYAGKRAWYPLLPHTRLRFAEGVGDDAGAMDAVTRHGLREISTDVGKPPLTMDAGPAAAVALPALADVDERLKPVDALLKWARRPDALTVSTLLTKADAGKARRAGVELIDDRYGVSDAWVVSAVDDPALQVTLAGRYAAGWLAVHLPLLRPHLNAGHIHEQLGTSSAEALGANLAGVAAWTAGERPLAQSLFAEALRHDGAFEPAQHNYGVALVGTGDPHAIIAGLQLLLPLAS